MTHHAECSLSNDGPPREEWDSINHPKPLTESLFSRFVRKTSPFARILLGVSTVAGGSMVFTGCGLLQNAEVRPAQKSSIEKISHSTIIPTELTGLDKNLKSPLEKIDEYVAVDQAKPNTRTRFYIISTKDGNYYVGFPKNRSQSVIDSYKVVIEEDQVGETHVVFVDSKGEDFIDFGTKVKISGGENDQEVAQHTLAALSQPNQLKSLVLSNPVTGDEFTVAEGQDQNALQTAAQLLISIAKPEVAHAESNKPTATVTTEPPTATTTAQATATVATTATVTTTATPEKPKLSPVEQAIKAGRLELKGENDWEKYFVAVSPEEAQTLLDEANAGVTKSDNLKFILPFDPSKTPNLILQEYQPRPEDNPSQTIGAANIPAGVDIYAAITGDATYMVMSAGKDFGIYCSVKKGRENHGIFLIKDVKAFLAKYTESILNTPKPVKIGDELLETENDKRLSYYGGEFQFNLGAYFDGEKVVHKTLNNLLRKADKIVYLARKADIGK